MNNYSYITTKGFYDSPVMLGATRIETRKEKCTMPIKDLTEIDRPPRQGMLRLGVKKKTSGGKEYPSEVSYFILDPETPDEAEKTRLINLFHMTFGTEPKVIDVMLENPDNKEQFPQSYKRYGKNTGLKCIGDGETAVCTDEQYTKGLKVTGKDERDYSTVECEGRKCKFAVTNDAASSKECKATGTLSVKIEALGGLGVWQVTTGSFNSIVNLNSAIRELIKKYGRAFELPLKLERRSQETSHNGKSATHYPLHLNTNGDINKYFVANQFDVDTPPIDDEVADAEITEEEEAQLMTTGRAIKEMAEVEEHADKQAEERFKEADTYVKEVIQAEADKPFRQNVDAQKQETTDKINLVKETFGAKDEDIAITDNKLDMPGAGIAAIAKQNREAVKAGTKLPDNFFEFMGFARGKLQAAKKLADYNKVLSNLGVKSPSELKEPDRQDLARIDTEELLEVNKII